MTPRGTLVPPRHPRSASTAKQSYGGHEEPVKPMPICEPMTIFVRPWSINLSTSAQCLGCPPRRRPRNRNRLVLLASPALEALTTPRSSIAVGARGSRNNGRTGGNGRLHRRRYESRRSTPATSRSIGPESLTCTWTSNSPAGATEWKAVRQSKSHAKMH